MKNKIQITIPEPCHEDWAMMAINQKGKFCISCQKNVIDFTTSSDAIIVKAYKENPKLCGRFTAIQLNRNLKIPQEKNSIWMFIAASIFAFLGIGNQEVKAQGIVRTVQNDSKNKTNILSPSDTTDNSIIGTVNDSIYSLPSASIENCRTKIIAIADFDGNFEIKARKGDKILVKYIGMKDYTFITNESLKYIINMQIDPTVPILQEIIVGSIHPIKKRSFIDRIFN